MVEMPSVIDLYDILLAGSKDFVYNEDFESTLQVVMMLTPAVPARKQRGRQPRPIAPQAPADNSFSLVLRQKEAANQIRDPKSNLKRSIKYVSMQAKEKEGEVFNAKRPKLNSYVPPTPEIRLGTDVAMYDNVLSIQGNQVKFNVNTSAKMNFSLNKLVYKTWDNNFCCLKCKSKHSLINKDGTLYLLISDEHSPAIVTSMGSDLDCVASIRIPGATLDELGEISFRNIAYGSKSGLVMGSLEALFTSAAEQGVDIHLGLTSGTSMLEGCSGPNIADMHNVLKRVTMSGDPRFNNSPLVAVKTVQYFSPLIPHVSPPAVSKSGAPSAAQELKYLDFEANFMSLRLAQVSTHISGQFNKNKEKFRISQFNQNSDPLLFSTFKRTELGQELAAVHKFSTTRHMHGNNKIGVPVTVAKIAIEEGLCTSSERGTKSLTLQSLAAYSMGIQKDLLAAAGKVVEAEFKDYFQARACEINIHTKGTAWAIQTRHAKGGLGEGLCANSSKHNSIVRFTTQEERNEHLRNCS